MKVPHIPRRHRKQISSRCIPGSKMCMCKNPIVVCSRAALGPIILSYISCEFVPLMKRQIMWRLWLSLIYGRTVRYFWTRLPPESPHTHPFQKPLNLGQPKHPSSTQWQSVDASHRTSGKMHNAMNGHPEQRNLCAQNSTIAE